MSSKRTFVFCYDISDDRRRARVARLLEQQAARVQGSVFEARLSKLAAHTLFDQLVRLTETGDKVRLYAIPAAALEACRAHGGAPVAEDGDYWLL